MYCSCILSFALVYGILLCTHRYVNIFYCVIALLLSDDEEEDVHLAPNSADDAPRVTNLVQESAGVANVVSSRPSGRVIGVIKRNWKS